MGKEGDGEKEGVGRIGGSRVEEEGGGEKRREGRVKG